MMIGIIGFNEEGLARIRKLCAVNLGMGVLITSNFFIGAIPMMQFAARAAPFYPNAGIVELHHPNKADAPLGTSTTTAGKIAATRAATGAGPVPDAMVYDAGARGVIVGGIYIHGVWLQGLVVHQKVLLGTYDETFIIRHDSFDRASFTSGVLAGVRWVIDHPGLIEGIEMIIGP